MDAALDLQRDDEAPPASGVRRRVPVAPPAPPDVLGEVVEEVFFEVLGRVIALSPLQGPWLKLGLGPLRGALLTAIGWRRQPGESPAKILRERWPELVPGYAAMDCLTEHLVDRICA